MKYLSLLIIFIAFVFETNSQTNLMNTEPWAYWLQDINIQTIVNDSSFEIIVFDYSADGVDSQKWTPAQIDSVKNSGKMAISYISIGEAEDYRYYWQSSWSSSPPSWLGGENPDWPGNYKVRFWDPYWQAIVFDYLDTILLQGFDGIYMDLIDAYYYWSVENPEQIYADSLMCQFVVNIRSYCDSVRGDNSFVVIPQNGSDVMDQINVSPALKTSYFNAINGIGVEDVFFSGPLDENNPHNPDMYRIGILQQYLQQNKQVYAIDYLTDPAKISQFLADCATYNYVPYVCTRALDNLCGGIVTNIADLDSELTGIVISPNPSSNEVNLLFSNSLPDLLYKIHVFDTLGQSYKVTQGQKSKNAISVNISALPNGVYFINISSDKANVVKKIVVSR